MKKQYLVLLLFYFGCVFGQNNPNSFAFDANYFTGNILKHAPDLGPLITGHPEGFLVSFSKKTFGKEEWERAYNYPDYGVYLLYQDFKNEFLGHTYAIGLHYNFYFLNRKLVFKISDGIAMVSNPHDNETNNKNISFGSKFLGNVNFGLNYKTKIIDRLSVQSGFMFTHFSNARMKSPNRGINTFNLNIGLTYDFDKNANQIKDTTSLSMKFKEPIKYNFVFRTGNNESVVVGSGIYPFYHLGFYADKRLNRKSALQFGTELFLTKSIIDFIKYQSVAYPELNLDPNTDYKRVGIFVGHELFINRISLETQIGYYVYKPFKYDTAFYDRLGMKYYISNKLYTELAIKTHGFLAEALEFGVGVRL